MKRALFLVVICALAALPVHAQSSLMSKTHTLTTTAIPGEWVTVVFEPTGNIGNTTAVPYWHHPGITLFGVQEVVFNDQPILLGRFFIDSAMAPGQYEISFQVRDQSGQALETSVMLKVGSGFPRELGKLSHRLATEVAITHANFPDGSFQALAHFKSRFSLAQTAASYRSFLNNQQWAIEQDDLFSTFGYIKAKKDGLILQVQLEVHPVTHERLIKVALDFPK